MSDTLSTIHTQATQLATSRNVASVVGFLPPDFIASTLVPLEAVSAPTDAVNAAAIESTTSVDLSSLNVDTNDYLAAVQAGDLATAQAQSQLLTQIGKKLVSDLASFTSPSNGSYVYTANTTSGWAQLDANNNPTPANGPPPSGQTGYIGAQPSGVPVPIPNSGTIDLGLTPIGSLNIGQGPWTLSGAATLDALNDSGTQTMAAGSALTASSVTLSGAASAELANTKSVTFGGAGETLKLDNNNLNVTVNGFVAGDTIDIAGQGTLTLDADFLDSPTGEVKVYNKTTLVATLDFGSNATSFEVEPVSDGHGGTNIIIDPTPLVTLVDPQLNGSNINWSFIHPYEGIGGLDELAPYVPQSGTSGVTVGLGVDLSTNNISKMQFEQQIFPDWKSNANLQLLDGAISRQLQRQLAVNYLSPPSGLVATAGTGVGPQSQTSSITIQQANKLDQAAETNTIQNLETLFSDEGVSFPAMPASAQTALTDLGYQFFLPDGAPRAWAAYVAAAKTINPATTPSGDPKAWATVVDLLQHFYNPNAPANKQPTANDKARRLAEADLIRSIPGVAAVALTAPVVEQPTTTSSSATGQGLVAATSAPAVATNTPGPATPGDEAFNFQVTDAATQYALSSFGSEVYTLTEGSGSSPITSLEVPGDGGPANVSISYLAGTTWSAPQVAASGSTIALPDVSGVKVTLLDANGSQATTPGDYTFYLNFAGAGQFVGDLAGNNPPLSIPPPTTAGSPSGGSTQPPSQTPPSTTTPSTGGGSGGGAGGGTNTVTSGGTPPPTGGGSGSGTGNETVGTPNFTLADLTTGQTSVMAGTPLPGGSTLFADITTDNLNITCNIPNAFIQSGSGNDILSATQGGNNVLDDAGGKVNFEIGGTGTGTDTFFLDTRHDPVSWNTIANFHAGDAAIIYGIAPQNLTTFAANGLGVPNYQGLTLRTFQGGGAAYLTLAGYSTADLSSGRLLTAVGTAPDGSSFLLVQAH